MKQEDKIDKQIAALQERKRKMRNRRIWKCECCGKGTILRKLHLRIMQYYVRPYSCNGGDYWTTGDNPEYNIVCPKCRARIRVYGGIMLRSETQNKQWHFIHDHRRDFGSHEYENRHN